MAQTFTTDLVRGALKSCRNSKAFGPDQLSIFHLKNLGPRAIESITTLFNLSVTTCQIPAICKSSLIIPISKPGKGSVMGPLLFIFFINDIVNASSVFDLIMYADDTTLMSTLETFSNRKKKHKH